jgi:hypothetical protein
MITLFTRALVLLLLVLPVQGAPLSGTKSVGPTGDYASLGAAVADVHAQTLGGALVLELQAGYASTVETFPLVFTNLGTTATNTLTVRPQAGATALAISSADTTAATVDLNGAQFVILDGRPGGLGTAKQLTIANTSTSGVALRFSNEASSNAIQYISLQGVNTSATSGTVLFSTTTGANGNDSNTLDHCDIGDGGSTPANGIYSLGSTGTTAKNNSSNTVSNCNLFNFYTATAVDAAGVRLDGGNTDWTFTGNSFYQTASHAAVGANVRAIYINNGSGNNFQVTGNFIGGSAPNAGGTAWTTTGTSAAYQFQGIWLAVGTTTASSVQGNTIQNFVWTSSYGSITYPGVWNGIYVIGGTVNVGTVTGNTIGGGTGTGSVSITTSGSGGTSYGIASDQSYTISICNNTIGSITVNGTASNVGASLVGIYALNGTPTINNNIVGSATTANSLNAATSSTYGQHITGILCSTDGAVITNNTVANLNNNDIGSGYILGIDTYSGTNTITGNVVRNVSTTGHGANTTTLQSVCGIMIDTGATGQTVSQNTVYSLANTAATAAVCVTGIYFDAVGVISRNVVHSLVVSSTSASSQLNGMCFIGGGFTAQNNVVRVGLDSGGAATAGAATVRGIYDNGTSAGRNFYHNTVSIGGTQTSGAASTFAFDGSTGVTNSRTYQNNIFVNARSNSGGTGRHYAARYGGTVTSPSGLTAGGNIFQATGVGGVLGQFNGIDRTTLTLWQSATGQDVTSAMVDPLFINSTGDATSFDLHLQASNPAEGGGTPLTDALTQAPATVVDDFDGQARSTLSPADIGADAGNFTSSSGDIYAPGISYPLIGNGSSASRVLTGWATIQDNSGSVAGGANAPRLYFKKSTDADVFGAANDASGNGWKYVTATTSASPYSFTIDGSLLNGGSAAAGDTIQYFVVAQDAMNNLGSSPATAAASANPPVPNISSKPGAGVNSFSILTSISGTKTVGSGGDYPSLSGAGGLFAAFNGGIVTGNVVVSIKADLTEDGSVSLNSWLEEGVGGYTLSVQPDSATMRTIFGNVNAALITLNGADRVSIDGSFGGSGRYFTFRNSSTGTAASTLFFTNDASGNTVRNCVVEGASTSTTLGVIGFTGGTTTGNNNNLITACQVRDLSTAVGVPNRLIGSSGNTSIRNSGNVISNNELFNFNQQGLSLSAVEDPWTISGNNIYEVNAATGSIAGISIQGGGNYLISGNFIHDLLTTSTQSNGISCSSATTSTVTSATIAGNRITAFNVNAATTTVRGVFSQCNTNSTLNIWNNQVTLSPVGAVSTSLYGLYCNGIVGKFVIGGTNVLFNSIVLGGSETGTRSSWGSLRQGVGSQTVKDNLFLNLRTGGTGSHFAADFSSTGGSYTTSNNVYAGTGATVAANFMGSMSFATWQSFYGDANSQAGIAGSGNFTSAMFADAVHGDLHLVPGGNPLVNAAGVFISSVTNDYDGDLRSTTVPTIGADEIPLPGIAVTQTSALTDGVGSVNFGSVTLGSSSSAKTFTITNPGAADLTSLAITGGSSEFVVSALSSVTVPVGSSSATFTVAFTPSASGARSGAIHISSNVSGAKNPFDIALVGTGLKVIEGWRQQYFGTTANSGSAADSFDFDNDGLPNLIEWACNLNPTTASALPAGAALNGANVEFTYSRSVSALNSGAVFAVEWSDTLANDWQPTGVSEALLSDDGTVQQVKATLPAGSSGHRFVHLKVTAPP